MITFMSTSSRKAFTLIELLIVVAIIAILAAIAVPNFLEAQTRAKVSRVKSDQRTIATAMESYAVDANNYPEQLSFNPNVGGWLSTVSLRRLTTPVAYLTSLGACIDIFNNKVNQNAGVGLQDGQPYLFANYKQFARFQSNSIDPDLFFNGWSVVSFGPDKLNGTEGNTANSRGMIQMPTVVSKFGAAGLSGSSPPWIDCKYDPTNGTISPGDIGRAGGSTPPAAMALMNN
jgi:prepilin-type N-terminal cleavage/methylation domain-containing protein